MDIESRVKEIVAEICEVDVNEIKSDTTIGDYPQWDSVGHLSILSAVEEKFCVNFEANEIVEIENVRDIVNIIKNNSCV